ncbi:MAG TPA: hypothetical protein VFG69_19770 [Nannocystaceae bacterium]|nr:hypothetical protein [Nannocystaceae bacterium]
MMRACLGLVALFVVGCPRDGDAPSKSDAKADAKPDAKTDAKGDAKTDAAPMGRVIAGPLPIEEMLGHPPADVEAKLGDPLGKGESRENCVRYVPERTWFRCAHARQRYADPSGNFKAVGVEFEDGKASALAFDGLALDGAFDPAKALAFVGLELPGEPKIEEPQPGTKVYSWFNASARLLIHGRQYRVIASTVGGGWSRSKVELILNDALNADELARKQE